MTKLWTPPRVSRELRETRRQNDADIIASLEPGDPPEPINSKLKEIDPRLYLGKAREQVVRGTPLKPGYWHVLRDNSDRDAGLSATPVEDAIGGYVEPSDAGSRLLETIKRNDLQRPGALEERERYRKRREMEEKLQHEEWLGAKVQEGVERWEATHRAFVSMSRDTPWTQSARARKEKRK